MSDQRPDHIERPTHRTDPRTRMDAPGQDMDARIDVLDATPHDDSTDAGALERGQKPDRDDSAGNVLLREGADAPDAVDIEDPDRQL